MATVAERRAIVKIDDRDAGTGRRETTVACTVGYNIVAATRSVNLVHVIPTNSVYKAQLNACIHLNPQIFMIAFTQ